MLLNMLMLYGLNFELEPHIRQQKEAGQRDDTTQRGKHAWGQKSKKNTRVKKRGNLIWKMFVQFISVKRQSGAQHVKKTQMTTVPGWRAQWSGQGSCARRGRWLSGDAPWLSAEDERETADHRKNTDCTVWIKKRKSDAACTLLLVTHRLRWNKFFSFVEPIPEWHGREFQDISQRLTGKLRQADAGQWRELQLLQTQFCKVLDSPETQTRVCEERRKLGRPK